MPPPIPRESAESRSRWQKIPQKGQGRWDKEDPHGDLEKQGHSRHHQEEVRPIRRRPQSRHKQQRYRTRQKKEEVKRTESVIQWEEGCKAHKIAQITNQVTRETCENYGFIPNLTISTLSECTSCAGKIPHGGLFCPFHQQKFHDHTTKKIIPAATLTVLGFGLKFIPIPKKSIRQDDVDEAIKRFDRDFYLKVFFADEDNTSDDEEPIEKLRVTSK
jgi:hypothetical protein